MSAGKNLSFDEECGEYELEMSGSTKIQPDEKQRQAISCGSNAVVSAGAGSGKTYVLTERFFRLVESGKAEVDQILTLTFTRKAAAEMFERIYRRLLTEQNNSAVIREQLGKFDQAQISTLDSFCSQIARSGAGFFGISPDFVIDDPAVRKTAEQVSLRFLMRHGNNPAMQQLLVQYGFERVWKNFFAAFGYKEVSIASAADFDGMEKKQKDFLEERFRYYGSRLVSEAANIMSLDATSGKSIEKSQNALACMDELKTAVDHGEYDRVKELSGTISLSKRGIAQSKSEDVRLLGEYIDRFKEHRQDLTLITQTLADWESRRAVFALLKSFEKELVEEKRRNGICSFGDVLSLAIETLKRSKDIRSYFKSMFNYIMIDEFQDNNAQQKRLLYLLAEKKELFTENPGADELEEGKLFFVGDDKQSIYRFRGADVSVFKALCGELTGEKGRHITMESNYRSHPGLIDFFNSLFGVVLSSGHGEYGGVKDNKPAAYEAEFLALEAGTAGLGAEPTVTLFYKPYDEEEDRKQFAGSEEAEAYALAEYISGHVEAGTLPVRDGDTVRPAGYNDFALLMRSTSNQAVYERIFRQFNIPYATDNVRTLFLEAPFNDFYNILQLALFPSDRTAYAAYLRSPLAGCSDEAIVALLLHDSGPFPPVEELSLPNEADRERYGAARMLFQVLRDKVDLWTIGRMVRYIWYDRGYRYFLLSNPDYHPYLEYFDYLYYLALDADRRGMTLSEFLDFMRGNLGKYERIEEIDILKGDSEGVQLLTIHKSKGLEFPVVLLANTGNVGSRTGGEELYFISPEYGLTFGGGGGKKDNYFYTLMAEERKNMEIAEIKRLLYVACTRARDHLVISGYHHRNNRNSEEAMLNMVMDSLGINPEDITDRLALPDAGGNAAACYIPPLPKQKLRSGRRDRADNSLGRKIDSFLELPLIDFTFEKREFSVTELAERRADRTESGIAGSASRELPVFPWEAGWSETVSEDGFSSSFGQLAHYAMERFLQKDYSWETIPPGLLEQFPEGMHDEIRKSIEEMTEGFTRSPLFPLLEGAIRIETEYPILSRYEVGGREFFVNGRIDLFFETEQKTYVVDFKTDRSDIPEVYDLQLQMYGRAIRAITGKAVSCNLFFLRDGSFREIVPDYSLIPDFP